MNKKIICMLLSLSILVSIPSYAGAHMSQQGYSWYCVPSKTVPNARPDIFREGDGFIDNYGTIYLGNNDEKRIYLTFDAGYDNGNVEKIVGILEKHNAPAAFFVLPHFIRSKTELVKRMKNDGMLVCNHSKSHKDMSGFTFDKFKEELCANEEIMKECTGFEMDKYFRPPEGRFSEQTLEFADKLGYQTVFWSLAYADWDNDKQPDEEKALNLLLSRVHNGCVLLLHPTSKTNANILDRFLCTLENDGYTFGSLDEFKSAQSNKISDFVYDSNEESEKIIASNRNAKKCVAITFDDGPHPEYTETILEILEKYGAKATFFVIGENAEKYPELVKKEFDAGHEIGNHTYTHPNLKKITADEFLDEVEKTQSVIEDITGKRPKLFRPPGGYLNNEIVDELILHQYSPVLWSWRQDSLDWKCPTVDSIVDNVMKNLNDGDIILFHDFNSQKSPTPKALEIILPKLTEMGYSFVTVSELHEMKKEE